MLFMVTSEQDSAIGMHRLRDLMQLPIFPLLLY